MKLLSIVIPTYNRCKYLDFLLSRLHEVSLCYDLQIIVCNNGSTDETNDIINHWNVLFNDFIIVNHSRNMGYDYNLASGYKKATSEYVWILGDSYLFDIDSFHLIIRDLTKYPAALLLCTRKDISYKSQLIKNSNTLLNELGWVLTNLSGSIIRTEYINNNVLKRYMNTWFIHFGLLFESLAYVEDFNVYYNSDIYIYRNTQIHVVNDLSKCADWRNTPITVFGKQWFFTVMSLPNTYSRGSKLKCLKDHARYTGIFNISTLAKQLYKGNIKRGDYFDNRLFIPFVMPQQRWKYDLIFLLVPTLPKSLHSFFRKIKHMLWPK